MYVIALGSLFNYLNINLANENNVYRLMMGDYYTSRIIILMGYSLDEANARWLKKGTTSQVSGAPSSQGGVSDGHDSGPNVACRSGVPQQFSALAALPTLADVMEALN